MRAALALALAILLAGCAGEDPYALHDTRVEKFASKDRVHDLRLMISLPRNYDARTAERFPVVYLLDAIIPSPSRATSCATSPTASS